MNQDTLTIIIDFLPISMISTFLCVFRKPKASLLWRMMLERDYPSAPRYERKPRKIYKYYRDILGVLDMPELDPFKAYAFCHKVFNKEENLFVSLRALRLLIHKTNNDQEMLEKFSLQNATKFIGIGEIFKIYGGYNEKIKNEVNQNNEPIPIVIRKNWRFQIVYGNSYMEARSIERYRDIFASQKTHNRYIWEIEEMLETFQ